MLTAWKKWQAVLTNDVEKCEAGHQLASFSLTNKAVNNMAALFMQPYRAMCKKSPGT
jgi:hypothetical protein